MTPRVLKNMNAFVDGRGYAGRVETLIPPKLTRKMEEFRGGGMEAPLELDMGHEKLEATLTMAEFDPDILQLWGVVDHSAVALQFRGATQRDSDSSVEAVVVDMRGRLREIDPGTWTPGEKASTTYAVAVSYYRLEINGQVIMEIDVPNMICTVGGVDVLAAQRAALGV